MFGYNKVLNATTGVRYTIKSAVLLGEELDTTPTGFNCYEIDLEPEKIEDNPIYGITLVVHNDGGASLTKNLDPEGSVYKIYPGTAYEKLEEELDDALIEDRTLIITLK